MSTREYHTKSRNSCRQCKKRHVKCNLQAPICSNCAKRKQWCDYQLLGTDVYAPHHHHTQSSLPSTLDLVPSIPNPPRALIPPDFTPSTFISLGTGDPQGRFAPMVVHEISKKPFLQHAFLALSALLQKHDSPSRTNQDYITAYTHHIEASTVFRHAMSTTTDHNWLASLVFAMTVVVFHFRVAATQPDKESVAETILVLRSGAEFARSVALDFLRAQSLITRRSHTDATPLDPQMLDSIASLEQLVDGLGWEGECLESVYGQSIQALRQWIVMARGHPEIWLDIIWWPMHICPEYIDLLAQRQPVALVIFLHWCAVMVNAPKTWFLDGWAENLARQAFSSIEAQWQPYVSWPSHVFGMDAHQFLLQPFQDGSYQVAKRKEVGLEL
ncbi:hypothetical protein MMC10_009125 [Thelotrema lepadinum]|nr:hypothetical protein [Thelotrema lepadinum]